MQFTWNSLRKISTENRSVTVYLAFEGFERELEKELPSFLFQQERFFVSDQELEPVWAQSIWRDCQLIDINSISDAAKKLKALGKWWSSYSVVHHRRAQLIQDQLPKYKIADVEFLKEIPSAPMGAWSLVEENLILASPQTNSPFPLNDFKFNENKSGPPSRAYMKLWEVMTVHNIKPQAGETVIDFGSSPGGWTWVLQSLGCKVISIDRADLDPKIARLPNIQFIKKDAFTTKPTDFGPIDWFFSDIICYPPKLYEYIQTWIAAKTCRNFVCTIKFQGETDFETMKLLKNIPNSRLIHLLHNKHEVTFILTSLL